MNYLCYFGVKEYGRKLDALIYTTFKLDIGPVELSRNTDNEITI